MDVDGRIEGDQPIGCVTDTRVWGHEEYSGSATECDELDGSVRKFLAVWRDRLRLDWGGGAAQRSLGVRAEHGRVDGGKRRKPDQPGLGLRYGGDAGSGECSGVAILRTGVGRCAGKSVAVWRPSL